MVKFRFNEKVVVSKGFFRSYKGRVKKFYDNKKVYEVLLSLGDEKEIVENFDENSLKRAWW